jgi:hypothetical protein
VPTFLSVIRSVPGTLNHPRLSLDRHGLKPFLSNKWIRLS